MKKRITGLACVLTALALAATVPTTRAKYVETTTYSLQVTTGPMKDYSENFQFNITPDTYTVPASGYYAVQLWGADGGDGKNNPGSGGKGAQLAAYLWLNAGESLVISTGGGGADGSGSGGSGGSFHKDIGGGDGGITGDGGAGGGGAGSDIRLGGSALANRIMTAGGGGGGGASGSGVIGGSGGNAGSGIVAPGSNGTHNGYFMPGQNGGNGNGTGATGGGAGGAAQAGAGGVAQDGKNGAGGSNGRGGQGGGQAGGGGGGYFGGGGGASQLTSNGDAPGGGGGGASFISSEVGQYMPSAILALLPEVIPYKDGYGHCQLTYIGVKLPLADADVLDQSWPQTDDDTLPAYNQAEVAALMEAELDGDEPDGGETDSELESTDKADEQPDMALTATLAAEAGDTLTPGDTLLPAYTLVLETDEGGLTLHMPEGETEGSATDEGLHSTLEQLALQAAKTAVLHSGNTEVVEIDGESGLITAAGEGTALVTLELWVEDIQLVAELEVAVVEPEAPVTGPD